MTENKEIMAKNLLRLMNEKQVTATDVCKALGYKQNTFSDWINAKTYPRIDRIEELANYFGVSKSDLVEEAYYKNPETAEIAQKLFENKEMRALFDAAQDATPEDLMTAYNVLLALKKKEHLDD